MNEPLVASDSNQKMVEKIVKPFFRKYDTDNSKTLEVSEFKILLSDLGEFCSEEEVRKCFNKFDTDKSGKLDLGEVTKAMSSI